MNLPPLTTQQWLAIAALFFLPCSSLNFGNSLTLGDLLLLLATLLNFPRLLQFHPLQGLFLAIFPFALLSAVFDRHGDLISVMQTTYLWGFVLPFGWVAFTNLSPRLIVYPLVLSAIANSIVAAGQSLHFLPEIGHQNVVEYGSFDFRRAAGLTILCNSLVTVLVSSIALIPKVQSYALRLTSVTCILLGLIATFSKSTIFAVPSLLYFFYGERHKARLVLAACLIAGVGIVGSGRLQTAQSTVRDINELLMHRSLHSSNSIKNRSELMMLAVEELPHCLVLGYGPRECQQRISKATNIGATVHVYYLGVAVTSGTFAALLFVAGIATAAWKLYQSQQYALLVYLTVHCSALLAETVLAFSFQLLPVIVATGAVLGACYAPKHPRQSTTREPEHSRFSRYAPA